MSMIAPAEGSAGRQRPVPGAVPFSFEELQMAGRNREMPLEALRYDLTPDGLHYLLAHFDMPAVDPAAWRLRLDGAVRRPLSLSLAELRSHPSRTIPVTMECAGNGRGLLSPRPVSQPWLLGAVGTAEWTGVPVGALLAESGLAADAVEVVFSGADRGVQGGVEQDYARSLPVAEAMRPQVLLAYQMNGEALPPQHGFPLRLVVPGWYGMASVKWLTSVEVITRPFDGYQQAVAYRYQRDADDPGTPVTRMRVRALMIPPGIPDSLTRRRLVSRGIVVLEGRAWSGTGPVGRVQVGVDGEWADAALARPAGDFAWRGWSYAWDARPGEHELSVRAFDPAGQPQPLEQRWNYQGMGNNLVQRVAVTVRLPPRRRPARRLRRPRAARPAPGNPAGRPGSRWPRRPFVPFATSSSPGAPGNLLPAPGSCETAGMHSPEPASKRT